MLAPIVLLSVFQGFCYALPQWDYGHETGPDKWPDLFEACSHGKQSPVNIDTANVRYSSSLTAFELQGYDSIPPQSAWAMENNGRTVVVSLQGDYIISEGGLLDNYKAAQFHFHWGSNDQQGAEHGIDGTFAPAELHIVHYNMKYSSLAAAADKEDGLAVLGFLYQTGNLDNPSYNHLLNQLENITYPDDKVDFRPIPLHSLLPNNLNNYYRYQGSLTTPPCYESVTWTIFQDKIDISKRQLRKFRTSLSSVRSGERKHLADNYRPVQPLNDRLVLSSNPDDATVFTSPMSSPISITFAAFIGVVAVLVLFRR